MEASFKRALEDYKSMELAEKQLVRVRTRIREAEKQLKRLDILVEKEYKEYQELENANLRKLFNRVLGKGEDQLEKEKQDYLEAVLNFNQKRKEIELMEFEQNVLREKLLKRKEVEQVFNKELRGYTEYLVETNSTTGKEILKLEKEIQTKLGDMREIDEAVTSGADVKKQLVKIVKLLNQAGWWGAPEWRSKNPLRVAANKIEQIDQAVKLIPIANHKLLKFIDELKDIYIDDKSKLDYNQTAFSRFSGGFYDSLIIDWILKGKAQNALNVVKSTHDKLEVTLKSLVQRKKNLNASLVLLDKRKKEIVMKEL